MECETGGESAHGFERKGWRELCGGRGAGRRSERSGDLRRPVRLPVSRRTRRRSQGPGLWGSRLVPRRARGCVRSCGWARPSIRFERHPGLLRFRPTIRMPRFNSSHQTPGCPRRSHTREPSSSPCGRASRAAARHARNRPRRGPRMEARTDFMKMARRDVQRTRGIECEDPAEASVPRCKVRCSGWRTEALVAAGATGGVGVLQWVCLWARLW